MDASFSVILPRIGVVYKLSDRKSMTLHFNIKLRKVKTCYRRVSPDSSREQVRTYVLSLDVVRYIPAKETVHVLYL